MPDITLPTPGGSEDTWASELNTAITIINNEVDAQGAALPLKLDVSDAVPLIFDTLVAGSNITLTVDEESQTVTIASTGGGGGSVDWDDITDKPTFATVATTGAYSDLTGKPALGTAASQNSTAFATAAQGVKADTAVQPAALSGYVPTTRTINGNALSANVDIDYADVGAAPTVHTHVISDVTGLQAELDDKLESVTVSDIDATGTPSGTNFLRGDGTWAVPSGGGGGGATQWGLIEGTLTDQTDLQDALDAKQDTITDSDDVTEGTTHLFLTGSERTKLGGIQAGAEVNTVDSVNGQTGAVSLDIPDPGDFATAAQGATADTAVQPGDLATVATTGAYSDLSGKPTLGTAAASAATDFATAAQGAKADSAVQPAALSGYVPTSRTINGNALSSNVTLDASDVGALPDTYTPPIPTLQEVISEGDNSNVTDAGTLGVQAGTLSIGATGTAFLMGGTTAAVTLAPGETGVIAHAPGGVETVSVAVENAFALQATAAGVTVQKDTTFEGAVTVDDGTFAIAKVSGLQTALDDKQDAFTDSDDITEGTTHLFMTGAERTKLGGVAAGATQNFSDATLLNRANHTGTQSADTVVDGTTNHVFTAADDTKLGGIATGATANSSDATLLARANHTGTQAASTISDFAEAAQDAVGGIISGTAPISATYNDGSNTIVVAASDASTSAKGVTQLADSSDVAAASGNDVLTAGLIAAAQGVTGVIKGQFIANGGTVTGSPGAFALIIEAEA